MCTVLQAALALSDLGVSRTNVHGDSKCSQSSYLTELTGFQGTRILQTSRLLRDLKSTRGVLLVGLGFGMIGMQWQEQL